MWRISHCLARRLLYKLSPASNPATGSQSGLDREEVRGRPGQAWWPGSVCGATRNSALLRGLGQRHAETIAPLFTPVPSARGRYPVLCGLIPPAPSGMQSSAPQCGGPPPPSAQTSSFPPSPNPRPTRRGFFFCPALPNANTPARTVNHRQQDWTGCGLNRRGLAGSIRRMLLRLHPFRLWRRARGSRGIVVGTMVASREAMSRSARSTEGRT